MEFANQVARQLAITIQQGRIEEEALVQRIREHGLGRQRWLRSFARRFVAHFGEGRRWRRLRMERFILKDAGFRRAVAKSQLSLRGEMSPAPGMCPAAGAPEHWKLPELTTTGDLARWLNLEPGELAWFSDSRTQEQTLPEGPLRHYRYHWVLKRGGSARLLECPKQRLKLFQRHVLFQLLNRIPIHPAAHGFQAGRSVQSFAQPHVGREIVIRLDLQDFFPSVKKSRVVAIFLTAGYPEPVAVMLAGLCTNASPLAVLNSCPATVSLAQRRHLKDLYRRPHLPQGAPTSPILANLAAFRLDLRLHGLAKAAGAAYTRYADDLVFSGDGAFARMVGRFYIQVCAIALEEGFALQTRKTRVMRRSVSQRAVGLVLNDRLNTPRREFDCLKAILHNCVVQGVAAQNRANHPRFKEHLAGRIAYMESINPARGIRLRRDFDRIIWPDPM
jgi:RNA-directed DNA polymerase